MKKVLLIGLLLSLTACSFFSNEPEMEASDEATTQEENQESTAPAVQPVDLQDVADQTQESQEPSSDESSAQTSQVDASTDSVSDESQSAPALEEDVSSTDTQSDD